MKIKKNQIYKLFFLLILIFLTTTKTKVLYANELGTKENPYLISNVEELISIKNNLSSYYKLTQDIDLEKKEWIPLGTFENPFKGNFDGNNFTIKNISINKATTNYIGLFGYASGATFKNLAIENAYITGRFTVGALVGGATNSDISNIRIVGSGNVNGNKTIGGLIGLGTDVKIDTCFVDEGISVTAIGDVGGLAGNIKSIKVILGSTVTNSYTKNKVNLELGYAGTIVGNSSYTTLSNVYSTGQIIGNTYDSVKGLVGYRGNSLITANSYFDITVLDTKESTESKTTAELQTRKTFEFWDFDNVWQMEEGKYPALKNSSDESTETYTEMTGDGTEASPYIIENKSHLLNIKNNLSASYKVTKDIDLKNILWEPIGTIQTPFKGKFDGGGYTIKNLYIAKKVTDNVGFFGHVDSGTIKNLDIENIYLLGQESTGGLVGYIKDGSVTKVNITGNVKIEAQGNAGGLIGYSYQTNVDRCSAISNVTGRYYVGGLIGIVLGQKINTISNSYAKSNLESASSVGGLIGASSSINIINSYFVGEVVSTSTDVQMNATGGLIGIPSSKTTVTNSYFDSTISKITTPVSQARTTEQLKLKETFKDWDFVDVWQIKDGLFEPNFKAESTQTEVSRTGSVSYVYDKTGKVIEATYESGQTLKYTYDLAGNILSVEVTEK